MGFNPFGTMKINRAETVERFNGIINYALGYAGMSVNKTWSQETFIFKNKTVFKVRVNEKTINLFFNLGSKSLDKTKYKVKDPRDIKAHEQTPSQYQITGPRKMDWAKELIDIYM